MCCRVHRASGERLPGNDATTSLVLENLAQRGRHKRSGLGDPGGVEGEGVNPTFLGIKNAIAFPLKFPWAGTCCDFNSSPPLHYMAFKVK